MVNLVFSSLIYEDSFAKLIVKMILMIQIYMTAGGGWFDWTVLEELTHRARHLTRVDDYT